MVDNLIGGASKEVAILPRALCAICQKKYHPRRPYEWFCNNCYNKWNKEIRERQPWVKFCISSELSRRRQERKLANPIFLGDNWDIGDRGNLVRKDYNG